MNGGSNGGSKKWNPLKRLYFKGFHSSKWRDSKCGETVSDVTYGYSWFSRNDLILHLITLILYGYFRYWRKVAVFEKAQKWRGYE